MTQTREHRRFHWLGRDWSTERRPNVIIHRAAGMLLLRIEHHPTAHNWTACLSFRKVILSGSGKSSRSALRSLLATIKRVGRLAE